MDNLKIVDDALRNKTQFLARKLMVMQTRVQAKIFLKGLLPLDGYIYNMADYLGVVEVMEPHDGGVPNCDQQDVIIDNLILRGPSALLDDPELMTFETRVTADEAYRRFKPERMRPAALARILSTANKLHKRSEITEYLDIFHLSSDDIRELAYLVNGDDAPEYVDSTHRLAKFIKDSKSKKSKAKHAKETEVSE